MKTQTPTKRTAHRLVAALAIATALAAAQSAWAAYYAWSGGGSSPFCFDDTANWGFKTKGSGMWIAVPAIGSRSDALNIDPTLLVNDGKGPGTKINFEGKQVVGVAYDVGWNSSFPSTWNKTITFKTTTSLTSDIVLNSADETISFVATAADCGVVSSRYLYVKPSSNLQIESGTYSFENDIVVAGTLSVSGAMLKNAQRYIQVGSGGNGTVTIGPGGVYENFGSLGSLTVAHASGNSGTLNVAGGTVSISGWLTMCYNASSVSAAVNVTDGGVLTVKRLVLGNAGTSGGVVTLDGGTLRAYADESPFVDAHDSLRVYAGANGATFDSNGKTITIAESIEDKSGEAGVVRFTGGGTITLSGTPSYTGGTTNVAGTVLSLTTAAKSAIVAHPVVVEIPAAGAVDGTVVFEVTDGGTFSQSEVDAMVVTGTDASRYALVLAGGGAKVAVSDTLAGEYVWNDGASAASWKTAGKWSKNNVAGNWYDSTAAVFANAGDAATVDADVAAASVTFRANATVAAGGGTLTASEVSVASGVSAAINAPTTGVFEKTGPGTLTLGASRTAQTTITEGTLVMSGADVTLNWPNLVLGTDATKPHAVKFENGAKATGIQDLYVGSVAGGSVEVVKNGGDWTCGNNLVLGDGLNATARFIHQGGTLEIPRYISFGFNGNSDSSSSYFEISGGTVTHTGEDGYLSIGRVGKPGCTNILSVKTDGTFQTTKNLVVGYDAAGTLDIAGGTVLIPSGNIMMCYGTGNENGEDCALNITDGGLLEARFIRYGNNDTTHGAANATVKFDNGTLKAVQDGNLIVANEKLSVTVASGGGTIDANGKAVTIGEDLAGNGGMTYKGGGTVTLSVLPAYSGKTTIEVGTTLVVPSAIPGAGLEFTIPEDSASGIYKVAEVSGDGAFSSDDLSAATKPLDANARFFLDNGGKEIWCVYSKNADDHIWIGGASGSLNVGANWLSGNVPVSGTAVIGSSAAAALTNPEGSAFAATTITVPAGSEAITISGAKFSGMSKITNNSSSTIKFENAVEFSGNVDVLQNTGSVKFTGGATGTWLARAMDLHGTYTFTGTGDRTELAGTTVKSNGVYNLPNATFYKHNGDFHMEAGGRAEVKAAKINAKDSDKHLLGTFNGEFKVNGEFVVSAPDGKDPTHYTCDSGNGTFIVDKIRVNQNACIVPCKKTIMGPGGIIRGAGYVRVYNSGSHEFGSYADWTMYHNNLGNTTTDGFVIYKRSSSGTLSTVTFDTTDYYDNTIGRTITSEAQIGAENAASADKFGVTVKGIGKFVFANTHDDANDAKKIFSGGLTVTNSATVEVMANSCPGTGPVTLSGTSTLLLHTGGNNTRTGAIMVNDGATLEVAESGTVTLGGDLKLNDGATLKFNFTDRKNAPKLDLPGNAVTFGTEAQVKVTLAGERPAGGKYILASGVQLEGTASFVKADDCPKWVKRLGVDDEGNLYADVFAKGLMFIFR